MSTLIGGWLLIALCPLQLFIFSICIDGAESEKIMGKPKPLICRSCIMDESFLKERAARCRSMAENGMNLSTGAYQTPLRDTRDTPSPTSRLIKLPLDPPAIRQLG